MTRAARLLALLLAHVCVASVHAEPLQVGVASVVINPPQGYRMAGYYADRLNTGTRDDLQAKAIVLRQGSMKAALIFCDLVSIPRDIATRARQEVATRAGIPVANVAVAATHSHTGPLYHGVLRALLHDRAVKATGSDKAEAHEDYAAYLVRKVGEAAASATASAESAGTIRAGIVRETGLSFNRRFHMQDGSVRFNPGALNPAIVRAAGPIDSEVGVLLMERAGKPFAGLTVFALHLDTVGGTQYSADYPFFVQDELRRTFGANFLSVFGAGTCGDINHIDVARRDRLQTEEIGRRLGRDVAEHAGDLNALKEPALAVASETLELPLQTYTEKELEQARATLDQLGKSTIPFLETVRAAKIIDLADTYKGATTPLEVQVFRLSKEVALVTLPGEVFVEHGLAIKKASPFRTTFVVELANACPNYIPTKKAFDEGSYEIVNSRLAPGGGEALVASALKLLQKLHGEATAP
jgi:neutral ceramidase